ncbi:MAG: chloride channel protein, partial [Clostridiales bacterium]|nr:chloride channel protein [Clostridiales bacterium]
MKKRKNESLHILENKKTESLIFVTDGLLAGAAAGLVSILYRFLLTNAETILRQILAFIKGNPLLIAGWFLILIILGIIVGITMRWEPMAAGSGIPQVSGEIRGYLDPSWWKVIVTKLFSGTLCIIGGMSLGREGPSIQLGAMAAKGIARNRSLDKTRERRLISCGAGAGLAAAFNAPLSGIIFILEEIHHTFDRTILAAGIVAAVTGDFLSKLFFGQSAVF